MRTATQMAPSHSKSLFIAPPPDLLSAPAPWGPLGYLKGLRGKQFSPSMSCAGLSQRVSNWHIHHFNPFSKSQHMTHVMLSFTELVGSRYFCRRRKFLWTIQIRTNDQHSRLNNFQEMKIYGTWQQYQQVVGILGTCQTTRSFYMTDKLLYHIAHYN